MSNEKKIKEKPKKKISREQLIKSYFKVLPYFKKYWFRTILALGLAIPIGSLDAVIALSLKPYMDVVMVDKTVQSPWYIPLLIVAFTTLQGFLNYLSTYMNGWVGGKVTADMKKPYTKFLCTRMQNSLTKTPPATLCVNSTTMLTNPAGLF